MNLYLCLKNGISEIEASETPAEGFELYRLRKLEGPEAEFTSTLSFRNPEEVRRLENMSRNYADLVARLRDYHAAVSRQPWGEVREDGAGVVHGSRLWEETEALLASLTVSPQPAGPEAERETGLAEAPEEGTFEDLATYRTATGKIALTVYRRWRRGSWIYGYTGLRAAGSGHPLAHVQDTVRSVLRSHPKDYLAEGRDVLEFTA
jgi:hypothetical protein